MVGCNTADGQQWDWDFSFESCSNGYGHSTISSFDAKRVNRFGQNDEDGESLYVYLATDCPTLGTGFPRNYGQETYANEHNYQTAYLSIKNTKTGSTTTKDLYSYVSCSSVYFYGTYTDVVLDRNTGYEITVYVSNRCESISRLNEIAPSFMLIDYNKSGKAMAFGRLSEARTNETMIETVMPIISQYNYNLFEPANPEPDQYDYNPTTSANYIGIINQKGFNSGKVYHIFNYLNTSNYTRYGMYVHDYNNISSGLKFRIYAGSTFIELRDNGTAGGNVIRFGNTYGGIEMSFSVNSVNNFKTYGYVVNPMIIDGAYALGYSGKGGGTSNKSSNDESGFSGSVGGISGGNCSMVDSDGTGKRSHLRIKVGDQYLLLNWGQTSVSYSTSGTGNTVYYSKSYTSSHYPVVIVTPKSSSITRWAVTSHNSNSFTCTAYGSSSGSGNIFWFSICCG